VEKKLPKSPLRENESVPLNEGSSPMGTTSQLTRGLPPSDKKRRKNH